MWYVLWVKTGKGASVCAFVCDLCFRFLSSSQHNLKRRGNCVRFGNTVNAARLNRNPDLIQISKPRPTKPQQYTTAAVQPQSCFKLLPL